MQIQGLLIFLMKGFQGKFMCIMCESWGVISIFLKIINMIFFFAEVQNLWGQSVAFGGFERERDGYFGVERGLEV